MISFILPTRDRPAILARTLEALGRLPWPRGMPGEVIVVDNASTPPAHGTIRLPNDLPVIYLRLGCNAAASGRNAGALAATGDWLIMLDDDSYPTGAGLLEAIAAADADVAAIGADIHLADGGREAGGLPEVIVGCGAAIRRAAFLQVGGYDPAFAFYAEEYDLCAKLLLAGWRIVHDLRFNVLHHKVVEGRDRDLIFRNLVRNNGWVMQRYAPPHQRHEQIAHIIERYGRIAVHEGCGHGFARGVSTLLATLACQPERSMPESLFDRFTGLAHARAGVRALAGSRAALVAPGKHAALIHRALHEHGIEVVDDPDDADLRIAGTLSPGPMLDAAACYDAVCPWALHGADVATATSG